MRIEIKTPQVQNENPERVKNLPSNKTVVGPIRNTDEFLKAMNDKALNGLAVQHPYLDDFANAKLPNMKEAVQDYASQYRGFSKFFTRYLNAIFTFLDEKESALLQENLEEELGEVDDEEELRAAGIDPSFVKGVKHVDLFNRFMTAVEAPDLPESDFIVETIAFRNTMLRLCLKSKVSGIAALAWGSELIVRSFYDKIYKGIQYAFPNLSPRDTVFFPLHILCDDKHSLTLINMAKECALNSQAQSDISQAVDEILTARANLWSALHARALKMKPMAADSLYDSQSDHWARIEPICLSDFTARPKIFDLCEPLQGLRVLDLGCGEGYCARQIKARGARTVVGIDISGQMVKVARREEEKTPMGIQYLQGSADDAWSLLTANEMKLEYDLVVAVFLFNYVDRATMIKIMKEVFRLLTPGGRFIFSVPHPSFPFWRRHEGSGYPFNFSLGPDEGYFDSVDKLFSGKIWRKDDVQLQVQLFHKTMSDYFSAIQSSFGADVAIPIVQELHADESLQKQFPSFFQNLKNIPLHMAFSIMKPVTHTHLDLKYQMNAWPLDVSTRLEDHTIPIPETLIQEFKGVFEQCRDQGINWDNFEFGKVQLSQSFLNGIQTLGKTLRQRLVEPHQPGFALLDGISLRASFLDESLQTDAMKLFYYLVGTQIGSSVLQKRGRLYDVMDRSLDVRQEDVLFSATNEASGYHTDSTDRWYFPDVVGLLCIYQDNSLENIEKDAGTLYITNACNVYGEMLSRHPARLLIALQQPIVRDLIGKGLGNASAKPIQHLLGNKMPVFGPPLNPDATQSLTTRYMRFWIETGHAKTDTHLSADLEEALNLFEFLAEKSPDMTRIPVRLEPGQMIFINNHTILHHRTAYQDDPSKPRRHMVRLWLGI